MNDMSPPPRPTAPGVRWRQIAIPEDPARIRALVEATGVFSEEEAQVAAQLVETTVDGTETYRFLFAERHGETLGYTCYDRVPLSRVSWDLYWIAVAPAMRGTGLAQRLVERTAQIVSRKDGRFVFAETSSRDPYAPARAFYRKAGFAEVARFEGFYEEGDDKVIYRLSL
jgi:ribosomal protein S18 acetylase RimI-like enzyme